MLPGGLLQSQRTYDELNRPLTLKTPSEGGSETSTNYSWEGFTQSATNAKPRNARNA